MIWQPINLNEVCPTNTTLTACSHFGFLYLDLLIWLYGGSNHRRTQEEFRKARSPNDEILEATEEYKLDNGYRNKRKEYDFIVIGAGSAGCVVANRLSKVKKWKILLLEAGPEQPDVTLVPSLSTALLGSNIDWGYKTLADGKSCLASIDGRCSWPRGKTMGGSSSINSLTYIRGNKVDYDNWARMGNIGWSYNDVLPYFKKSETNLNIEELDRKYHGEEGEQFISKNPYIDEPSIMLTEAFHEAGLPILDYNGAQQLGTMQAQTTSKGGERVSTNNAFIQPIRYKRKNLIVKTNSEAIKILVENKQAYGVKYIENSRLKTAYVRKEVIVSCGAINSPKLLLLSGIGSKADLQQANIEIVHDLAVGENLHDHITFNGIIVALPNQTATTVTKAEILHNVIAYKQMQPKKGLLTGNGPVNTIAFIKTEPNLTAPDIQYQVNHANRVELLRDPVLYDSVPIFPTSFYNAVVPRTMNLVPESRGKLTLNTTNPHGPPLLDPNYFGKPTDLIPLIKGVRFLLSLENTRSFKRRGAYFIKTRLPACKDFAWGSDDYIICLARAYTSSSYHPVGTCKMGPRWDKKAVVDPRLKVYGILGLRVIDASIMPVVPRGNTNAPSIMVGERGVAFVLEDWKKQN